MKKVSIIIPTFNQGAYLPACIDHCVFQTYGNLEIIVVDGGSSDGTKKYLGTLEKKMNDTFCHPVTEMDERGNILRKRERVYPTGRNLHILTFEEDLGATRTYNEGLKRATGEYCTYIVGDDLPHPHMIEELVHALETTEVDFVYSDLDIIDDHGRILRQVRLSDYDFETCFARWYHLGVSRLYRTVWHSKVGLMDLSYKAANDYDHYLRFAMSGCTFHHVPKVLYSVRHHGQERKSGQHTNERYANLLEESKKCARRARKWLKETAEGRD